MDVASIKKLGSLNTMQPVTPTRSLAGRKGRFDCWCSQCLQVFPAADLVFDKRNVRTCTYAGLRMPESLSCSLLAATAVALKHSILQKRKTFKALTIRVVQLYRHKATQESVRRTATSTHACQQSRKFTASKAAGVRCSGKHSTALEAYGHVE